MALHFPHSVGRSHAPVRFIGLGLCISFLLFFFWHHPPASLLLLALAAVLAYLRLEIALALLPLTFPYYEKLQPLTASGYPAFSLNELGLFICLGVALLRHIFRSEERRATQEWLGRLWQQARPLLVPALLFLLGASLALLVSPDLHNSLRAYREEVVEPLLYFLLILRYLRNRADLARAIGALILSALLVVCLSIVQGFSHVTSFADFLNATKLRVSGPTPGPNNVAFQMDRTIPLLMALTFLGLLRRPVNSSASQPPAWRDPLRWVCLVLLIPSVWALYWTDSRGAEVAILVVVFFFIAYEIRSRLVILVIGGVGILSLALLWPKVIALLNEPGHGAASQRLYIWKAGLLMIRDHFLLGTGPDSFNTLYRPSAPNSYLLQALNGQTAGAPNPTLSHPHDFILDFWISTGLLGVVAVFWLLGAFARVVLRVYQRCAALPQGPLLQRLVLGIAGCMLASVAHGLVDNMYFLPDLSMTFWFFIGMLLVVDAIVQQETGALHDKSKRQGEKTLAA
jgi:putative inorganic carbon (HCO3(-)) transporter